MKWWQKAAGAIAARAGFELRSLSFQDVWGQGLDVADVQGRSMTTAVSLVPVWACTRLIAESIAAMPLQAYRTIGDEQIPIDLPALFQDPSRFGGPFEWVQRALISLLLRGGAFGYITSFTYDGWPRQVEWLHPDEFAIMQDNITQAYLLNGRADWRWYGRPIAEWAPRGDGEPGQLVHIPWYVIPGFIRGLSPIAAFATTIDTGLHAQKYGRDWFKSGGKPGGVLESGQPINQQMANEIKGRFKTASAGGDVAVVGAGLQYKPITVAPEEAQFLGTIRAGARQVESIYGLPPGSAGGEGDSAHRTYANVEQEAQDKVNALLPYLTKLEIAFSNLMPRGNYVRFKVDSLIRADLAARYAAHQIALGMNGSQPFMTVNEVRSIEGLEPIEAEELEQQQVKSQIGGPQILPLPPAANGGEQ
jgi:HK97 family phage portal protein